MTEDACAVKEKENEDYLKKNALHGLIGTNNSA